MSENGKPLDPLPSMVIYRGSGEWSALYVDGKLAVVGDHYHADERVFTICGVEEVQSDAFLRGQHTAKGCAQTLEELQQYEQARAAALAEAAELREQAAEMVRRAAELEGGAS